MPDQPTSKRRAPRADRRGTLADSMPRVPVPGAGGPDASAPGRSSGRRPRGAKVASEPTAQTGETIDTPGRLTLPSMPRVAALRGDTGRSPALSPQDRWEPADAGPSSSGARRSRRANPPAGGAPYAADSSAGYDDYASHDARDAYGPDSAEPYPYEAGEQYGGWDAGAPNDAYRAYGVASGYGSAYSAGYGAARAIWDEEAPDATTGRQRAQSLARPLTPALPQYNDHSDDLPLFMPLPDDSVPALAAYRPVRPLRRARLNTRALARSARDPWTITRLVVALVVALLALSNAPARMGEQPQPLMIAHAQAGLAAGSAITDLIQPETQLKRPDLYDNDAQFNEWGGAACSAAALSEILTAYGVRGATIGHEIDELGPNISPYGGLLSTHGFEVVAAKHGLRADLSSSWTYDQIVYMSQQLGMPVIVNVRMSYGYYSFFSGGHFLVVTGGDAQGLKITDSSEYYIHYLPKDVFYQMFTGRTAAIVPADYQYTLPNH